VRFRLLVTWNDRQPCALVSPAERPQSYLIEFAPASPLAPFAARWGHGAHAEILEAPQVPALESPVHGYLADLIEWKEAMSADVAGVITAA
jgi:hypothetical protein